MDIGSAILTLLATVVTGVLGMLGTYAAKLLKDKIGIAGIQKIDACLNQKKELASIAVRFAQQAYKDLGGEEKLAKAAEYMSTVAQKNGIRLNSDEVVGLLESSLKEAKNTFSDTWKKTSSAAEVTPQIDIVDEAPAFVQELFPVEPVAEVIVPTTLSIDEVAEQAAQAAAEAARRRVYEAAESASTTAAQSAAQEAAAQFIPDSEAAASA